MLLSYVLKSQVRVYLSCREADSWYNVPHNIQTTRLSVETGGCCTSVFPLFSLISPDWTGTTRTIKINKSHFVTCWIFKYILYIWVWWPRGRCVASIACRTIMNIVKRFSLLNESRTKSTLSQRSHIYMCHCFMKRLKEFVLKKGWEIVHR